MRASAGKRVLMLLENNPFPPDDRVVREANALVAAGYRVTVIAPARPGQPSHEEIGGVRVYRFRGPRTGPRFVDYLWEYLYATVATFAISLRVLFRSGFDVVHLHNPPDTLAIIGGFYKLLGKRFVFDHHDLAPEMYEAVFGRRRRRIVHRALLAFELLACRLADHVIATNESYRQVETERDGVPADRVTIVRNGPDLDRLRLVEPDPELRASAGTIVGYVGVMGYQDGVEHLLRAVGHLVHDLGRRDVLCICIGRGDAWVHLNELAARLDILDQVWLPGFVSDAELVRYLSTADICVDPDPANAFTDRSTMMKMMEYMALSKPVVAFDLPEHRVSAGAAAIYVQPNDDRAMAQAIADLADDPDRRREMGAVGRRRVVEQLAWEHSVPHLLAAYAAVLRRE